MRIGVLALQGAFREHLETLHAIGVEGVRVREPADLADVSGLILPGGESTTMRQLIERWGLHDPIMDMAERGAPIFGTCAGMIVLAAEIAGGEAPILPLLDVTVERNAFGRQLDSFEADLDVPVLGSTPVHGVFIRAPIIERTGPEVDVLARLDDGRIVAVRQRNIIATAFHPELAGETRFHRLVATMASEHDDPGEGSGRRPYPTRRSLSARNEQGDLMSALRTPRSSGKVRPARLTDLAALGELSRLCQSDGADTRSLGLPGQRPADRGVQPVPPAARCLPPERPDVRLRGGRPDRRARPGRARERPRRMDDRGARCGRDGQRRRDPLPPRPAAAARRREAGRGALPRRLRRCRRQRRAADAGRVHALRRGARPVPGDRPGRCPSRGPTTERPAAASARRHRSTRCRSPGCTPRRRPRRSPGSRPSGSPTGSARGPTGACRARA